MSTFVKKVTSAVAGLAIVFSMVSPIAGVSAAFSGLEAANKLATLAIIEDQSANPAEYRLGDFSSREELSKVISKLAGLAADSSDSVYLDTDFASWSEKYAKALNEAGIAASNTYFNPKALTSKIEALKWVMEARDIETGTGADWMEARVNGAVAAGIAEDFSDYNASVTRGQVFIWAAEAIAMDDVAVEPSDPLCELLGICEEPTDPTDPTDPTTPVTGGNVAVSLSPLTPTANVVAAAKPRTPLLAFDVTAGASDVSLDDIIISYVGLSNSSDFSDLAVYSGNKKVTKGLKGFSSSSKEARISFERDTVVQAGKTVTLMVSGNVAANGNVAHQVAVVSLGASANVTLGTVRSVVFGTVNAANTATLDIKRKSVSGNITVGDEVTFANFDLEEKADNEDIVVKSVTMKFDGSADHEDDIADLYLTADGVVVAEDLVVDSNDEIIVDLDYLISGDERVNFRLKGIVTGSIGDTLRTNITEAYAIGSDTGIIATITQNALITSNRNIDGAEVNVSFEKSNQKEAKPGAEDVLVGTLNLDAASDYNVNEMSVTVSNTATALAVTTILTELEVDGRTADNVDVTNPLAVIYTFEDIYLTGGQKKMLDIVAELDDAITLNGEALDFVVKLVELEDEENDKTFNASSSPLLSTILSSNSFSSKKLKVQSASLVVTQSSVSGRTLVLGNGLEVVLYRGKINVGDADAVNVRDIELTGTMSGVGYNFTNIIDGATLNIGGETTNGDVFASSIEFNNSDIEIAAGAKNVDILITATLIDTNAVSSGDTFSFDIAAAADIVAEDTDGEDVQTVTNNNTATDALVTLNDNGTFAIAVVNNGDRKSEIDDTVLAGTNSVAIAEVNLEAEEEDIDVEELRFTIVGAYADTIENARIMAGSTVIADGGVVTIVGGNTQIEFEDFVVADTGTDIDATLVVDLNVISSQGGVVSASAGNLVVNALVSGDMVIEGVSSNDPITGGDLDLSANVNSTAVAVVPALMTVSVSDTFGLGDITSAILLNIDMGDNDLNNDGVDVVSTTLAAHAADITEIINKDNNDEVLYSGTVGSITGQTITFGGDTEVKDGDELEFRMASGAGSTRLFEIIRGSSAGLQYTIDSATYGITNTSRTSLGTYSE